MHVSRLFIHPIKSCASLARDAVEVRPRGAAGDRRWMLVDEDGRFVTGRKLARLVTLRAEPIADGLRIEWQGERLDVAAPAGEHGRCRVTVWKSEVDAALADPAVSAWLSRALGAALRLVHMDTLAERWAEAAYAGPAQPVSFADGFPWLLLGQSALDALNHRVDPPLGAESFRPNIVFEGGPAHAEDGWQRLRIGDVVFRMAKPSSRCVFTTVDPERGERRADGQPLKALKTYRERAEGVMFGVNLVAEATGTISLGDALEVLA